MGSATTLRLGNLPGTQAPSAPGESLRADGPAFLSTLAAAGRAREGTATTPAEPEPEPLEAAEDPALAAMLAAMLPGLTPATAKESGGTQAEVGEAGQGGEADASAIEALLVDGAPADARNALDEAISAQLAKVMNEEASRDGAGADDVLSQLTGELAAAVREGAPDLRAASGLRASAAPEIQPGIGPANGPALPATAASASALANAADQLLRAPVGSPRWAEQLGSRLVMMSTRGQHEGSLSLSPEHLGPLEVRISLHQSTANVWFGAQHADTRAALAEALPRLRELFAEAGLSLGHAGVSQDAPRRELSESAPGRSSSDADARIAPAEEALQPVRRSISGLLDLYA